MRVLAALDNDPLARPVLEAGRRLAEAFHAELEVNHVAEGAVSAVQSQADAARVELGLLSGSPVDSLARAFNTGDTLLGVLGSGGRPGADRPVGGTTHAVMKKIRKPLVVVNPHVPPGQTAPLQRVLAPLDGSEATAEAVEDVVVRVCASGVQVNVQRRRSPPGAPSWARLSAPTKA